jgi:large subunit ribosomal protein L25
MEMVPLRATARTQEKSAKEVRRGGAVPCILYGNEVKNTALQCGVNDIAKAFARAGESTLVDLEVDGKKVPVLFHAIQFEPVSGRIMHVDFYAVNLKKEIETPVPVRFTGEAPAVKELSAVFVAVQNHVTVRCLPTALPHDLEAPCGKLVQLHAVLTVADLIVPANVKIKDAPSTVLATVQEQRKEEEIVPVAAAVPAEGEVAAAPAAEGEEGVEGAKPTEAKEPAPAKDEKKEKKGKKE